MIAFTRSHTYTLSSVPQKVVAEDNDICFVNLHNIGSNQVLFKMGSGSLTNASADGNITQANPKFELNRDKLFKGNIWAMCPSGSTTLVSCAGIERYVDESASTESSMFSTSSMSSASSFSSSSSSVTLSTVSSSSSSISSSSTIGKSTSSASSLSSLSSSSSMSTTSVSSLSSASSESSLSSASSASTTSVSSQSSSSSLGFSSSSSSELELFAVLDGGEYVVDGAVNVVNY